jgi:hypothetical protein
MKVVRLQKGHQCADVLVLIDQTKSLSCEHDEQHTLYEQDADDLFKILISHLPGGTYDALCARFKSYWRQCESGDE